MKHTIFVRNLYTQDHTKLAESFDDEQKAKEYALHVSALFPNFISVEVWRSGKLIEGFGGRFLLT